jgi:hypothetical protein
LFFIGRNVLPFPVNIKAPHKKKLLKLIQPGHDIFSKTRALDFARVGIWIKVLPKLHKAKHMKMAEQTRLRGDLGFRVKIKIAR